MKPLERIFFQACIMKRDFMSVREIINIFSDLGFPINQLWYYLSKWGNIGFYDYGVTEDLGWFEPDKFTAEYKVMYEKILKLKEGAE